MRIQIADYVLCSGDLDGPSGITLNGQQVVDEERFFRAAEATHFARGGRSTSFGFTVRRLFASDRAAQLFLFTHPNSVPTAGVVQILIGSGADTQTIYLGGAVVDSITPQLRGRQVLLSYAIRGGLFRTTDPRLDPAYEDPTITDGVIGTSSAQTVATLQQGLIMFHAGTVTETVLFATVFDAPPIVEITIGRLGQDPITLTAAIRAGSITKAGFTLDLSAAPPDWTYMVSYVATKDESVAPLNPPTVSQGGYASFRTGSVSAPIVFPKPFAAVPQVFLALTRLGLPSPIALTATIRAGSITATGCIVDLSDAAPDWTYQASYTATVP